MSTARRQKTKAKPAARRPASAPRKAPSRPAARPASPKPKAPAPAAKPSSKPSGKPAAGSSVPTPLVRRADGRVHVLSLSFVRDGDEFLARMETDAGQITELKNRGLDQLLTLVASELEDLLE
jgi:hypothetical protein